MAAQPSAPPFGLSPVQPVFDRATRVARSLFGTADSTIVLMENGRAWRSHAPDTLPAGDPAAELVMASGELLWIEDGRADPRFADDPLVTGAMGLRFYAGAPVRLANGDTPGLLCVASREPRPYDARLARCLQDLADAVADECDRARLAAEAVRSAQELDATRRTLAAFVEGVPVLVVMTDRELRLMKATPRFLERFGLTEAGAVGRSLSELSPDVLALREDWFRRALEGEVFKSERFHSTVRGRSLWLQVEATPWRGDDGQIGGVMIAAHDMTDVVGALERLKRSDQRLQLVLEMSQVHVYDVDYVGRSIETAGAPNSFYGLGMSWDEITGEGLEFVDPRDRPEVVAAYQRHILEGAPCSYEFRVNRQDGQEVWVQTHAQLTVGADGAMVRALGAMQDVTPRKQAERALLQAKEEAEAASRAKSTFLATMSHEIRTPLNGVLGMAQAMAADPMEPEQRQRLDVIRHSGETLLAILNDILDLSKIEAGKLDLEDAEFDLAQLARGAHAAFTAQAEEKGLAFELEVEAGALGVYRGDATRVRQILYNLVSNAVKFTEAGEVRVAVSRPAQGLTVSVTDTGIGIPADRLSTLFQKFEQADASTTRRFGGTGLGLSICRELAGLMGGEVTAASQAGEGSTFTAVLPLPWLRPAEEVEPESPRETAGIAGDLRILAAEDNPVNQLVLATLLGQLGVTPAVVPNGAEAVERWESGDWDVILMDVQMPVLDGPGATRQIREREAATGRRRTPIIALTANAMSHQVADYLAAGMDDFVPKPVEVARLYAAIEAALASVEADEEAAA